MHDDANSESFLSVVCSPQAPSTRGRRALDLAELLRITSGVGKAADCTADSDTDGERDVLHFFTKNVEMSVCTRAAI